MKFLKKFNEELNPETYISAGNKLEYRHPDRSRALLDYGANKLTNDIGVDMDKEWEFVIGGNYPYNGILKGCKFKLNTQYPKSSGFKSEQGVNGNDKLKVGTIRISINGLKWGEDNFGDDFGGSCFAKNRQEALELKEFIKESINIDIPINSLYTTRPPKVDTWKESITKKSRWDKFKDFVKADSGSDF